jgi:hypothetical protein
MAFNPLNDTQYNILAGNLTLEKLAEYDPPKTDPDWDYFYEVHLEQIRTALDHLPKTIAVDLYCDQVDMDYLKWKTEEAE